jgi:hypothetical protein
MKTFLISIALIACCSALMISPALAAPATSGDVLLFTLGTPSSDDSGAFDAFVGQGDLVTRAVPVCCCSSSVACDQDPPPPRGTPCKPGTPICKCGGGIACVNMP